MQRSGHEIEKKAFILIVNLKERGHLKELRLSVGDNRECYSKKQGMRGFTDGLLRTWLLVFGLYKGICSMKLVNIKQEKVRKEILLYLLLTTFGFGGSKMR